MQNLYHGFPPYFRANLLPIIVLIGAAEKRMMLDEFDAVNKKQKEENKKSKDMLEKIIIEQRKGQRFEALTQLE